MVINSGCHDAELRNESIYSPGVSSPSVSVRVGSPLPYRLWCNLPWWCRVVGQASKVNRRRCEMQLYDVVCLRCGQLGKSPSYRAAEIRASRHERKLGIDHLVECWPVLRRMRSATGDGARERTSERCAASRRIPERASRCTSSLTGVHGLGRVSGS